MNGRVKYKLYKFIFKKKKYIYIKIKRRNMNAGDIKLHLSETVYANAIMSLMLF